MTTTKKGQMLHKKSNVFGRVPSASTLGFGEIAVNYNEKEPFLAIKTSGETNNFEVVKISSDKIIEQKINDAVDKVDSELNELADTVVKTTPQTLSDADKNQALTNLGLSDVATVINDINQIIEENERVCADSISELLRIVEDNEEVTSAALNELNTDIKQLYKIVDIESDTLNTSNGFFQESDENLKTFISNIEVDLEKIAQLPKKFFMWSDKRDENIHIGTSAQAVQELYPEIVKRDKNGNLMVDYSKLSVIALKAIDVLNEERKQMKADIAEIKNKLGL